MKIPDIIYLQIYDDDGNENEEHAITWCEDRMLNSDIKYEKVHEYNQKDK